MTDPKAKITVYDRQVKDKLEVIKNLKTIPIVELACKKANIARSTFYKWKSEDKEFANNAEAAMEEGLLLVNDLSESQLLNLIKDKKLGAITFWLKHRHVAYGTRVKIEADIKNLINKEPTPEQDAIVKKAIELASIPKNNE